MGSPISSTIVEIFLQHIESMLMKQMFDTKNIDFYTRYVDDILLIYNSKRITPEIIHDYINQIHPNLQFNPTHKNSNSISFLDLLITRNPVSLELDMWCGRKVMRLAKLCMNQKHCCLPLYMAVRLTPAIDSVQV